MKKRLFILLLSLCSTLAFGQVTINNFPYSQNFDGIGNTATAALPTGFKLGANTIDFSAAANTLATTQSAGTTGGITTGGAYNFANGANATSTDRAIGFLSSGSFISPRDIFFAFTNNTGNVLSTLNITFDYEKYRTGTRAFDWTFFHGSSATSVNTPATDGNQSYAADAANVVVNPPTSISKTISLTGLSIANGATYYLRWRYAGLAGSTNAQGLGIDNIVISSTVSTNPALSATPISISGLNYTENNGPSAATSYNLSGVNLTPTDGDITITAPTNFEVSTSSNGTFSDNLTVPYTGGALAATPIFVRLKAGLTAGPYGGASTFVTNDGGGASTANVAVSGTVNPAIGSFTPIGTARTFPQGTTVNIAGRVTVAQQFGGFQIFIQDITGGISVYQATGNMVQENSLAIGDSVQVTGTLAAFNQLLQVNVTQVNKVAATSFIPQPKVITSTQILDNEGILVQINDVNIPAIASFAAQTNYTFMPVQVRITQQTNSAGYTNPLVGTSVVAGTGYVIGIAGRFNTSAQLLARLTSDIVRTGDPAPGSTDADFDGESTLDVACWNIEWFGTSGFGPTDEALQMQNAKTVIKTINADIYNVNEISNLTAFNTLVTELNTDGFAYSGVCSSRLSNNDNASGQRVCFIYKTALFSNVTTKHIFETIDNALDAGSVPTVLNAYPDADKTRFWASGRLPFTLTADVNIPNSPSKKMMFVGVHGRANTGTTPAEALSRYNMRKFDVEALKDTLDAQFSTLPIVMLGDFNDDIDFTVATTAGVPNNQTSYIAYNSDPARYNMNTRSLSDAGLKSTVGFSDMIDHIISSNELTTEYIANSARVSNAESYITSYGSTTSDHYPVMLRFNLAPANPCATTLILVSPADDYTSGTQIKQASSTNGKITATNAVTGTANTTYQAKAVELNAGFKADNGTIFKAEIGGCN